MIKINKAPVLTSINYGINDFEINESLLDVEIKPFEKVKTKNVEFCSLKSLPQNNLSKEIDVRTNTKNNFAKKIVIEKSCDNIKEIVFDASQNLIDILEIDAKKDANAKIIIKYISNANICHSATIKITAGQNAKLDVAILCNLQNAKSNMLSIETKADILSQINLNLIDFCANITAFNIRKELLGDASKTNINSMYFGKNKDRISLNYLINVYGKNCDAKMDIIGVLDNMSQKNFIGTINFLCGSTKSVGDENEYCMLLSENAKSKATPMLLCGEEDVDGKHSSSCGKFDEGALFYLESRGIKRSEAIKILVKAKLRTLINKLFSEELKQEVETEIDKMFDKNN